MKPVSKKQVNRKGQVVVLRELFSFAMGVVVLLGIITIFNTNITPELEEYSVNEQAYSMLFHVYSLMENSMQLARSSINSTVVMLDELPLQLSNQPYRIYPSNDNQLCIRTRGDVILNPCINMTLPATINGNYLSGTFIQINATLKGSELYLNFSNLL